MKISEILEEVEDKKLYEKRKLSEQMVSSFLEEKPTLDEYLAEVVDEVFKERFEKFKLEKKKQTELK